MPVTAPDIKIRKSQRLTDNPDGGGRMVQAEVVDGVMNNLFPNIGDEERTTGRTTLRKAFVHVDTPDTSILADAIGVLLYPPEDGNISVAMFGTGSYSDVRADARNRIESYITKGAESRYILLGNHFVGQQAISMYCMSDAPTPDINDNLCLSTIGSGYLPNEQYVRVGSVLSRTTETFYDDEGAFQRDVIIVESVTALLFDFYGQEATRRTSIKPPTRVYRTNVVDAASYFSVKTLVEAADAGDLAVQVGTPFVPIVPSTNAETPVTDQLAGLGAVSLVQSGATDALTNSFSSAFSAGVAVTRYLGNPFVRGSVKVSAGSTQLTDDGDGNLTTGALGNWEGAVDYLAGSVSLINTAGVGNTAVSISATPAGPVSQQSYTISKHIVPGNQTLNHVFSARPLPAPGTVTFDYRALGKWIRLADNGLGQLVGNPGEGSGTINYATGSVVATCGAMPDLESDMILGYGTGVVATRRDGDVAILPPSLHFYLPDEDVSPGSVSLQWVVGGSPVTATDPAADGVLKIGATVVGSIVYATGEVYLRPATLPDTGTAISCNYDASAGTSQDFTPTPDGGGVASISLPGGPHRPGSIRLGWLVTLRAVNSTDLGAPTVVLRMDAKDDGAGNIVGVAAGGKLFNATLGTVNYTTGAVSCQFGNLAIEDVPVPDYQKNVATGEYWRLFALQREAVQAFFSAGTIVTASWQEAAAAEAPATEEVALPAVVLDLTPGIIDSIVPGSVRFIFRAAMYVDRSGSLYRDVDPITGAGTYAGTIDYDSGTATITSWTAGGGNTVTVLSLLVRAFEPGTDALYFRTPGSPLAAGAFTLSATTLDGEAVTASADINGVLAGDYIDGTVKWDTGAAKVRFGEMVPAAGNEGEPWYDVANVVGANVWKPKLMIPSTIRFNTVVFKSIPLSSVVVGLDPTRLPADGRVPGYKSGQTVLVHHTQVTTLTPVAGAVTNLGRTPLAACEIRDSASTPIDSAWYEIDLAAGTVTWSDPLNLGGYVMPVVIRDRIENRRLCSGVQITGAIELNTALDRAFPMGSMVSSCLRLGEANGSLNLQARVENLFDQLTWSNTSEWQDVVSGSPAAATFNDTDFPIAVDNRSAITERWAIVFTSSTAFEVRGETVGTIATGSTAVNCAPVNPRTGLPYFTIPAGGWGIGWAVANALRFNTVGGLAPVWFARTVLPGTPETTQDGFRFEVIGNSEEVAP